MRPGRQLAVLGLVFVVLYLLVFFAADAKGSFTDRLHPKLGLDLVGGTRATYVSRYQSIEALQQVLDMGIVEGATLSLNQIDDLIAS